MCLQRPEDRKEIPLPSHQNQESLDEFDRRIGEKLRLALGRDRADKLAEYILQMTEDERLEFLAKVSKIAGYELFNWDA